MKQAQTEELAEWESCKRESKQTKEANEKRIDAFEEKMESAGSKIKAKYGDKVEMLKQRDRDVKKKLVEYKDDGQSNWEEFKTNFKHDPVAVGKIMTDLFKDNDWQYVTCSSDA